LDIYLESLASILSLNPTTLAPAEGALTGLIFAYVYGERKNLSLWKTLDALTPAAAALAIFWGLAHLAH
jgi:hypothetical protein